LRLIFTEDIGFDTDIFETAQGGYVAFRVTDVIDSKVKPLSDVKDDVLRAWEAEQIQEALTQRRTAALPARNHPAISPGKLSLNF